MAAVEYCYAWSDVGYVQSPLGRRICSDTAQSRMEFGLLREDRGLVKGVCVSVCANV